MVQSYQTIAVVDTADGFITRTDIFVDQSHHITASPQDISLRGLGGSSHANANVLSRIPETLLECACYEA